MPPTTELLSVGGGGISSPCVPSLQLSSILQSLRSCFFLPRQVDIWAVGILAYELLMGHAPFECESKLATYENILLNEPRYPLWLSSGAISFIKAVLCKVSREWWFLLGCCSGTNVPASIACLI